MQLKSELICSVAEGGLCLAGLPSSLGALPPGSGRCVHETCFCSLGHLRTDQGWLLVGANLLKRADQYPTI